MFLSSPLRGELINYRSGLFEFGLIREDTGLFLIDTPPLRIENLGNLPISSIAEIWATEFSQHLLGNAQNRVFFKGSYP